MINYNFSIKHMVETGTLKDETLNNPREVGEVHRCIKRGYFKLYLNIFPGATYYIVKDDVRDDRYTIYSNTIKTEDGYDFEKEIGYGDLISDQGKDLYLRIRIPILKLKMFMNWAPAEESNQEKAREVNSTGALLRVA